MQQVNTTSAIPDTATSGFKDSRGPTGVDQCTPAGFSIFREIETEICGRGDDEMT